MKEWSKVMAGVAFWGLAACLTPSGVGSQAVSAAALAQEEKAPEGLKTKTENHYNISIDKGGVPQKESLEHQVRQYDGKGNLVEEEQYGLRKDVEILEQETDFQYEYYGKKENREK